MAALGNPSYSQGRIISIKELNDMNFKEILYSYIVIDTTFKFPDTVKYPSIPCYIDETTTVYPLEGSGVLTGAEYLLAKSQGCVFGIREIYYIPFQSQKVSVVNPINGLEVEEEVYINYPFKDIIQEIQKKRKEYPKGSINNLLYKEIGNSIYGSIVRGMSDKRKFEIKTGKTIRISGNELSNPIIASWITGFIRSIIGESLHLIHDLGGKVVSVTTDGFITNIADLENQLISKGSLIREYKEIRSSLCGDDKALELKSSGVGIIS